MTTSDLYNNILNARWYIAEHACILADYDENGDPYVKQEQEKLMNLILNTKLLETHYLQIIQSGGTISSPITTSTFLSVDEIIILSSRINEMSTLPIKT